jgi:hypothetical protein
MLSRPRPGLSAGWPSFWTESGMPGGFLPPSTPSRGERYGRPTPSTSRARWRSHKCCCGPARGSCSTGALVADGGRRVAVIVEPAHPAGISPLLMSAYGLTQREQEVTRLVLQGERRPRSRTASSSRPIRSSSTSSASSRKTGVRSRRDPVGKVFFTYYEPRVRDNERRMLANRPLRGGPHPA